MEKLLVHTSWGPTDPTRAGLAFTCAMSAKSMDLDVTMFLFGDAVLLALKAVYPKIMPFGPPPVSACMDYLIEENVKIYVCKPCFESRALSIGDMVPCAELKTMEAFVELSKTCRVIGF